MKAIFLPKGEIVTIEISTSNGLCYIRENDSNAFWTASLNLHVLILKGE